jgi:putative FmdB family regulatory protein
MPTYDYRCAACGHALEIFHGISEKPRRTCPKCKKQKLERLISAGLVFKGSGFYLTDYRSKSYTEAAQKDKPAPESKPEAQPAAESPKAAAPEPAPAPAPAPSPRKPGKRGTKG